MNQYGNEGEGIRQFCLPECLKHTPGMTFFLSVADPHTVHSVFQHLTAFLGSDALEHFTGTLIHMLEAYALIRAIRKGQAEGEPR